MKKPDELSFAPPLGTYNFLSNWNRFKRFHSLCLCLIKSFYINDLIKHSSLQKTKAVESFKRFQFDGKSITNLLISKSSTHKGREIYINTIM